MKHLLILILLVSLYSSCGTKNAIVAKPKSTQETAILIQVSDSEETPAGSKTPEPSQKDNAKTISLGEDGIITDDGVSITTEIIYDEAFNHSILDTLLSKYVSEKGDLDYKSLKQNSKNLRTYIELLKTYQPAKNWTKNDTLAYWINAYNALTIDIILHYYPIQSIKDIKDPWDQRLWKFGDKWINLNEIEHEILRKMDEPRIHFAIVCASVSCPKLQNKAYVAAQLNEQLTMATKEFLADPTKNELTTNQISLSKIFKWFKKDFEQNGSLIDFLNQYTSVKILSEAKRSFKDYNWDLND